MEPSPVRASEPVGSGMFWETHSWSRQEPLPLRRRDQQRTDEPGEIPEHILERVLWFYRHHCTWQIKTQLLAAAAVSLNSRVKIYPIQYKEKHRFSYWGGLTTGCEDTWCIRIIDSASRVLTGWPAVDGALTRGGLGRRPGCCGETWGGWPGSSRRGQRWWRSGRQVRASGEQAEDIRDHWVVPHIVLLMFSIM